VYQKKVTFLETVVHHRKIYLGVLLLSIALVAVVNFVSPRIYHGTATLTISPIWKNPAEADLSPPIPEDLVDAFTRSLTAERLSIEFPEANISAIAFQPIRRSTTSFAVELEGTDPSQLSLILTRLPRLMNSTPYIEGFSKHVTALLTTEQEHLDQVMEISSPLEESILETLRSKRFGSLSYNPLAVLSDIKELRKRHEMNSFALKRIESGLISYFDRPVVSQDPIRPRKALNFIFWPFLALLLTTLGLSLSSKRHDP
jgi:hypothetical protein